MGDKPIQINLGGGRMVWDGWTNIDITQFIDGKGKKCVDIVMDIEKEPLPFDDNSVSEIRADNILEHIDGLKFAMNECHRVLKPNSHLEGIVPVANTKVALKDPTHKRVFILGTFEYFVGNNPAKPDRPFRPKYADYGFLPWYKVNIYEKGDLIHFIMTPRKI